MDIKIKYTLIGLLVGWFLTQATNIIAWHLKKRRLEKAILEELDDLEQDCQRTIVTCKRGQEMIQDPEYGGQYVTPSAIQTFVRDTTFKEIYSSLPSSYRRMIATAVYSGVDHLNNKVEYFDRTDASSALDSLRKIEIEAKRIELAARELKTHKEKNRLATQEESYYVVHDAELKEINDRYKAPAGPNGM